MLWGMGRIQFGHAYDNTISVENLLAAWKEFLKGKRKRVDVQEFQYRLLDNLFALHDDLKNKMYVHGAYHAFNLSDPKPRNIHKATVRDRVLHRVLYRALSPFFERTFIADSYSCRKWKGTHRAMDRFRDFSFKAGKNHTRNCFVLKCDIRKFFANIDHGILFSILAAYIPDANILCLIKEVVGSFSSGRAGVGLPLGNLTSQLLVNIYMNEFDQFVKHKLKAKYYIRYADDFVILHEDRRYLEELLPQVSKFLGEKLKLTLHPDKVFIKTIASGVDFLGWVHFPDHRVLRTSTKRRMFRRLAGKPKEETVSSYLGLLSHGNAEKLRRKVLCYHS